MIVPNAQIPEVFGTYGVIVADPPWDYANWTKAKNGSPNDSFQTLSTAKIAALCIPSFAAKDCVLLLWVPNPKLKDGLEVCEGWGFEFVTKAVWVKTIPSTEEISMGVGFHFRGATEDLWLCKKGNPKSLCRSDTHGLLHTDEFGEIQFYSPRKRHSEKPLTPYTYSQKRFPGPFLECFARKEQDGWTCLGDELGFSFEAEGVRVL